MMIKSVAADHTPAQDDAMKVAGPVEVEVKRRLKAKAEAAAQGLTDHEMDDADDKGDFFARMRISRDERRSRRRGHPPH